MKTNRPFFVTFLSFVVFSLFVAVIISGCSKDDDDGEGLADLFTVEGGSLRSGSFPEGSSSGPEIDSYYGNSYVLPGGSNAISIETQEDASHILVGVEGQSGYYEIPFEDISTRSSVAVVYLYLNPELDVESFSLMIALRNGNDTGIARQLGINLVEAGTGKLQVNLSWDKEVDMDLYLVEPNGQTIYYGMDRSDNGGWLDIDSNAGCDIDGIKNENITYGDEAIVEAGEYVVRVNLWSECEVTQQINYISTVRVNGNIISPSWGTNPKHGFFPAGSEGNYGDEDAGIEVIKFAINAAALQNVDTYARFSFPPSVEPRNTK